jgi:hypothetical protein
MANNSLSWNNTEQLRTWKIPGQLRFCMQDSSLLPL